MALEIERKFLVKKEKWQAPDSGIYFQQGYIFLGNKKNARIRIAGKQAKITIKSKLEGLARLEFEYEIPLEDAEMMLRQIHEGIVIQKKRYKIDAGDDLVWEVDEFFGDNEGLLMAEIELSAEDQSFEIPDWIGKEVTDDPRYFNAYLAEYPFKSW